ncbi:MAG: hypothetical protein EXS08_09395 [Planctomycetes bacterium]|nr:hypothetical protein [Planctomycetota bacterium]
MRRTLALFLCLPLLGACRSNAIAFVGANVLAPDGERFEPGRTVLVVGERIARVGPDGSFALPIGARTLDAHGRWLIPGLADAHGHPPDAEGDAISFEQYLLMQLAAGVTSVRSMRGTPAQLEWRARIARGEVDGPTLYVAGMLDDPAADPLTAEGARDRVRALAAAGYDHLKLLGGVDRATYFALAEEARAVGLPFCGHAPEGIVLADVLEAGQGVEHLGAFASALEAGADPRALAQQAAEAYLFQCPTQHFRLTYLHAEPPEVLRARDGVEWMPRADRERWEHWLTDEPLEPAARERGLASVPARLAFLRALDEAGAPLLVSGSHGWFIPPGFGMLEELRLYARAGISNAHALRDASRTLAEFYGAASFGAIAPGQRADLVLLAADPLAQLDNLRHIEGTLARGKWYEQAELLARIGALRAATDAASSGG